jgi:1-phosphatidylinositol-4-phosphate 5-kinase
LPVLVSPQVFKGLHVNGLRHGKGEFLSPDGSRFYGDWKEGQQTGCAATRCVRWLQRLRAGFGLYTFGPQTEWRGDVYEGDFVNGLWEGRGTYKFANGDSYVGEYRQGRQCGFGRFNNANGSSYIGQFKDGVPCGKGAFFVKDAMIAGTVGRTRNARFVHLCLVSLDDTRMVNWLKRKRMLVTSRQRCC